MVDDFTIRNWKKSVTATRAGGMDFQKVQEQRKWQEMIKRERELEMGNFLTHIQKWHREGKLGDDHPVQKHLRGSGRPPDDPGRANISLKYPMVGLGARVPDTTKPVDPDKFFKSMRRGDFRTEQPPGFASTSLSSAAGEEGNGAPLGFAPVPGKTLSSKQLVARLRTMQKTLKQVRAQRKETESQVRALERRARRKGTRTNRSARGQQRGGGPGTARSNLSVASSSSLRSLLHTEELEKALLASAGPAPSTGRSRGSRRGSSRGGQSSSNPASEAGSQGTPALSARSLVEKRFSKWNGKKHVWEHFERSFPRGAKQLNERDTYHSQQIASLFRDSGTPARTNNQETMLTSDDLVRRDLIGSLSAEQMKLWSVSPKYRCPRVMSPLTKFAEHAVKNKLKPFSVGRG